MKQISRYNEGEMDLVRRTFNNEELLKAIQKVFFQLNLSAVDLAMLNLLKGTEAVVRKTFLPEITDEVPFDQTIDLTATLDLKNRMYEEAVLHIKSNDIVLKYLNQQIKVIEKGDYNKKQKIQFSDFVEIEDKTDWQIYVDILTRNNILSLVQARLMGLRAMAESQDETEEEKNKRLQQDSAK